MKRSFPWVSALFLFAITYCLHVLAKAPVKLAPEMPWSHYDFGQIYDATGRHQRGRACTWRILTQGQPIPILVPLAVWLFAFGQLGAREGVKMVSRYTH